MKPGWQRNIVLFLASQTITLFGSSLVQYAILWYITLTTDSGTMMTVYIICGFLPTFFLSPFAGVWADRYNRKLLIVLSDAFIAASTLLLAVLFFMGHGTIWLLLLLSALRAVGTGIQTPAVGAILPDIVPQERLMQVNAVNSTIQSVVGLASPMASGALMTMTTIEAIFLIDVVTAAIAIAVMLLFLHIPVHAKAAGAQSTSYLSDLAQGIDYIRKHGYIQRFFVLTAILFFLLAPASFLTPLQVARSFGEEIWRLTAIEVAFSVGMILGGVIMAWWGGFHNRVHSMVLAYVVFGICTVALGLVPSFWIYLLVTGIYGVAVPVVNTPATVMLQERIDESLMGRVFGVYSMIMTSMMPVGMLVFGPVADFVQIEILLVGTGVLIFALAFAMLGSRELVQAGEPAA